jgi:hypothetical protein
MRRLTKKRRRVTGSVSAVPLTTAQIVGASGTNPAPVRRGNGRPRTMANYMSYDNLPPTHIIERDHGEPLGLLEIFRQRLEKGKTYQYGSGVAMLFNQMCCDYYFNSKEEYKATAIPIMVMILEYAGKYQTYGICSPSFQKRIAKQLREYYPNIRGKSAMSDA